MKRRTHRRPSTCWAEQAEDNARRPSTMRSACACRKGEGGPPPARGAAGRAWQRATPTEPAHNKGRGRAADKRGLEGN
eukprot:740519-Alexandrium_andersonii.AAC.1